MRRGFFALLIGALPLAACASILGLEDAALGPGDASLDAAGAETAGEGSTPIPIDCGVPLGSAENCAACGHSCLGAQCLDGGCAVIPLLSGVSNPSSIALDDGAAYFALFDALYRVDKQTNQSYDIFGGVGGGSNVQCVALDGDNVYWAARDTSAFTCPKTGCTDAGRQLVAPKDTFPLSVAISNDRLLFDSYDSATLFSVRKADGTDARPLGGTTRMRSATIVVDSDAAYLADYFGNAIVRVPLDGSSATTLALAVGASGIVLVGDSVYFGSADGSLGVVSKAGGDAKRFGAPQTRVVSALATDGVALYWADQGTIDGDGNRRPDGCIWRCPLAACTTAPPTAIQCGQYGPYRVAVDGRAIYWTNLGAGNASGSSSAGSAQKMGKPPL